MPKVGLPTLTNISYGMSAERFDRLEAHGSWFSSDEEVDDKEQVMRQPIFPLSNPDIPDKPARIELTEDDMASDSDEYVISDQSSSCSDVATEEENDEDTPVTIFHKMFKFGEETSPGDSKNKSNNDGKKKSYPQTEYLYDINEGAIVVADRTFGERYFYIYESIVIYLQSISDALDEPLAFLFVTFDDYDLIEEDDCGDIDEFKDAVFQNNMAEHKWWKLIIDVLCGDFMTEVYITQRAIKLLIGAAQDTIIRCFKEAHSMDPNDEELQVETFRKAVAKLFPNDLPPVKSDVKSKTVKKKKKKIW